MERASHFRPVVDPEFVTRFVERRFGTAVSAVQPVGHGAISRAFGFSAGGRAYVVRFSQADIGYETDRLAFERFASPDLPIPRVVETGRVDGLHYAVSERAVGVPLADLTYEQRTALLPAIVEALDRVHRADVSGSRGYGWIGSDGDGVFPTWRAYLESIDDESRPGFWRGWRRLFDETFLERDVWQRAHDWMSALLPHCPEVRHLIHGDFSGTNVLSDGERITAVTDWAAARYGDFLFDVAYQDWQSPARGYLRRFRETYARRGQAVPHFDLRVACYAAWLGMDALRFCARTGDAAFYRSTRAQLLALIASDPFAPLRGAGTTESSWP